MQETAPPPPAVLAALDEHAAALAEYRRAYGRLAAATALLDSLDAATACGYRSLTRLLGEHARLDPAETRRLLAHSRRLHGDDDRRDLPATAEAAAEGAVGEDHVSVIAAAMTHLHQVVPSLPPAVLDGTEAQFAGLARARTPRELGHAADEILARLDADGRPPHDTERPAEELRMSRNRHGELTGRFRFADPETALTIYDEIVARTPAPEPDADITLMHPGRDLAARRGDGLRTLADDARRARTTANGTDDGLGAAAGGAAAAGSEDEPCPDCPGTDTDTDAADRPTAGAHSATTDVTAADRAEDAPVTAAGELAASAELRALPRPPSDRGPGARSVERSGREPTMTIVVPLDVLEGRAAGVGLLDGRYAVTAETARRLACEAAVVPAVLGARGEILDLGRKTRVVSAAQRRAVIARDRHCAHPGCRRSPQRCEVHHVVPWARDGPTDLDNLVLLCPLHHHQIHHSAWHLEMISGRPVFTPPRWIDPDRRPRANHIEPARRSA